MNARKTVRAVEVLFDCEHLYNCPHLLTPGHWTKNTFPREGAEDWTAVRLTVDDKLRPLFFDADGCSLYVALSPQAMLIRETVRSLISGDEFLTFSSPRRVAYGEHFDIAFSLPVDFPRFVGKARVRFEAMVDEASVALSVDSDIRAELVPGFVREGQRFIPANESDVFVPVNRERIHAVGPQQVIGPVRENERVMEIGNVLRENGFLPARRMPDGSVFVLDPDAPLPPAPPSSGELEDVDDNDDVAEQCDRARTVARVLESCEQELARLEDIPSADADDVNAISAAKGYVARARLALTRRFA